MKTIFPLLDLDPLKILEKCGGYYECPKDAAGKRIGPLVGYAGKYDDEHQWVGDVYANFAKAERHGPVLHSIAERLITEISAFKKFAPDHITGFCGAPEGGKALANTLATWNRKQYIFPEKRVTAMKTERARQKDELYFDRHEPESGEYWWIVEDVCNNFSTTAEMIELIRHFGASVAGIVCFLNRSLEVENHYLDLPVISLVRKPISQYKQDDPLVAEDVRAGNVVWKPKIEWSRLAEAMGHDR